jgi:indolepyruvate ferredoxin oxidoreductase alpha subunit
MNVPKPLPGRAATDGNRAIAQAAIEARVGYFSHYPGSPVNRVDVHLRDLSRNLNSPVIFNDSLNEHIAVLAAAGASYSGMRSMVVMKHVGMNIAADPLNYLGYTGVNGGMVVVVGTDPGATCSTGEEDVHWYVPQINFPLYEPSSVAQIRDCVVEAFETSESASVPVLVFVPAAMCFNVDFLPEPIAPERASSSAMAFKKDKPRYTNVGEQAVRNHRRLLERLERLSREPGRCAFRFNEAAPVGLVTRGVTFGHVCEAVEALGLGDMVQVLNVERVYPLNNAVIAEFARTKRELIVVEDQDGFLENQIKMRLFNDLDCRVYGKEYLPQYGAVTYHDVQSLLARVLSVEDPASARRDREWPETPARMGTYCEGCPHRSSFYAIETAVDTSRVVIGGDIGCSSLPPHKPDWLLCMNAGIGIAQGMGSVLGNGQVLSTGGDGSFFHMGLIALMNAVFNKVDLLHILLDNSTIAMTGHQASPSSTMDVAAILEAVGVDQVVEVSAFQPGELQSALQSQMGQSGVRVIWVRGACALQPDSATLERRSRRHLKIHNDRCGECRLCYETLQCPAINLVPGQDREIFVDSSRCMRCGVCIEICPANAIEAIES